MAIFIDTNILLYSISLQPIDLAKSEVAKRILRSEDCVLSVQVLQEFYVQATRRSRPDSLPHALAVRFIHGWRRFRIEDNSQAVFNEALSITERFKFSLWDSLIIAAALASGCDRLMSEDMSNGQTIEGLTIINPFA